MHATACMIIWMVKINVFWKVTLGLFRIFFFLKASLNCTFLRVLEHYVVPTFRKQQNSGFARDYIGVWKCPQMWQISFPPPLNEKSILSFCTVMPTTTLVVVVAVVLPLTALVLWVLARAGPRQLLTKKKFHQNKLLLHALNWPFNSFENSGICYFQKNWKVY